MPSVGWIMQILLGPVHLDYLTNGHTHNPFKQLSMHFLVPSDFACSLSLSLSLSLLRHLVRQLLRRSLRKSRPSFFALQIFALGLFAALFAARSPLRERTRDSSRRSCAKAASLRTARPGPQEATMYRQANCGKGHLRGPGCLGFFSSISSVVA